MADVNTKSIHEFISKWGISRQVLSNKTGVERTNLHRKINPDAIAYKLTDEQFGKLKSVLKEMKKELDGLI